MLKVFTNGVFDVLTVGHFNVLQKCRWFASEGGKVIVAVDEDEKVMADKGLTRPIYNVHERMKALCDLKTPDGKNLVDEVHSFHSNLELEMLIKRLGPDYIVKGGDWQGKTVIGSSIARVVFVGRLGDYSTTETIRRCHEKRQTQL